MIYRQRQTGFTAVELLITLFIAAVFLIAGYQLYAIVIKDGNGIRDQVQASDLAYVYMRQNTGLATKPCTAQTPLTGSAVTAAGLSNVTVTVVISCPYSSVTSISEVTATVYYNIPQQSVTNAVYVSL